MARLGLDIGSRFTKLAYARNNRTEFSMFDSATFYREYGTPSPNGFVINLRKLGFGENLEVVATGYGRERAKLSGAVEIPEIQAHALGAMKSTGERTFTLIDFGGQDTKIIRVEQGMVVDFTTSDRCAASTGRFLENMAKVLGMELDELSQYYEDPAEISSTCAVFAETELLEKISMGIPIERLAAGVNYSIVKRFAAMIRRFPADRVVATGGVAKNNAVIRLLSEELGVAVLVPKKPQFMGALGCLVYEVGDE